MNFVPGPESGGKKETYFNDIRQKIIILITPEVLHNVYPQLIP